MTTHCKPHLLVVNLTISLLLLTISGLAMPSADATVVSSGDAEGNMAQVDEIQAELESAPEEIDLELKAKPSQLPISQQVQKAVRLAEGGRPADALKVLSNIPNDDPNLAYTYHKIGNAFYDLGMLKDAFAAYDAATWSNKSYYYSWYNKGNTLSDLGDQENYNSSKYRDAVSMYDVALNISSSYYLAAYNKGNQLFKLQNYTEAIDAYDNAIKDNRNYHFAWYNRGNAFFEIGYQLGDDRNAYNKAILSYKRALEAEPKYYFALNNLAHVLSRVGQDREALKAYTDALIIRPNFTVAYNNLGFLLMDQGQYPEAITEFNRIIKNLTWNNQNMSSSSDLLARAYFGKGTSESRLGMYDNATQDFDKAADILPSYFQAMHYKGVLLNDLGRYDEAKTSYDDAITVLEDKFNASAPIYLGKIHNDKAIALDNVGDYFGALRLTRQ
jgi:tetratricopeptide (TPR) repeat protein